MRTLVVGPARFRVGPWQGRRDTAQLVPLTPAATLVPDVVDATLQRLRRLDYTRAYTAAVGVPEAQRLTDGGFAEHERLHLLRHDLGPRILRPARRGRRWRLSRGRRRDLTHLLEIDRRAFDDFWSLDELAFGEALEATPTSRLRVARAPRPVGYAITGRAGEIGYLQRLAVDPPAQGRGVGSALVADALRWVARRGARVAYVNTQRDNTRALALYERLGFGRDGELVVLRIEL